MWGVRRVRGDGGMRCVRAESQWGGVDVVVVHHWARQHQLEQTVDTKRRSRKHRKTREEEEMLIIRKVTKNNIYIQLQSSVSDVCLALVYKL